MTWSCYVVVLCLELLYINITIIICAMVSVYRTRGVNSNYDRNYVKFTLSWKQPTIIKFIDCWQWKTNENPSSHSNQWECPITYHVSQNLGVSTESTPFLKTAAMLFSCWHGIEKTVKLGYKHIKLLSLKQGLQSMVFLHHSCSFLLFTARILAMNTWLWFCLLLWMLVQVLWAVCV